MSTLKQQFHDLRVGLGKVALDLTKIANTVNEVMVEVDAIEAAATREEAPAWGALWEHLSPEHQQEIRALYPNLNMYEVRLLQYRRTGTGSQDWEFGSEDAAFVNRVAINLAKRLPEAEARAALGIPEGAQVTQLGRLVPKGKEQP